ncbi:hypothetical protein Tco_0431719 [Tanacetum coccineum]
MVKYLRKVSRVLFERITGDQWEKHKEAAVYYVNLKASIDDYYNENIAHRDQTDKLLLKTINTAVKDDPAVNQKINEATEAFPKISSNITEVLSLVKGFDFSTLLSTVKDLQAHALEQDEELASWAKSSTNMAWNLDTSSIKSMMTEMYNAFRGQSCLDPSGNVTLTLALTHIPANVEGENATHTATEEPPSHTKGETDANNQEKPEEPKQSTDANIEEGKCIATDDQAEDQRKLVKASFIVHPDPDEPKADEEARLSAISKPEVIKVVHEEAKKLGIHLKEAITTKAGELFKKAQEHAVLKRQHTKKVRKYLKLGKHKYDSYMWTISSRLKPKPITDIKIHPKTKLVVITVYRGNDGRNFDVHNPFLFGEFGIFELDELREFIPKKKNAVVKDLMNSLSRRYERLRKIHEELIIHSALPAPAPEQALSQYGIFFTDEFGDQGFQRWSDIDKVGMEALVSYLVATTMVKSLENARFGMKLRKLIAEHPNQEKLKLKKVKMEALGYKMD